MNTRSFEIVETLKNNMRFESKYCGEEELPQLVSDGYEVVAQVNGKILVGKRV